MISKTLIAMLPIVGNLMIGASEEDTKTLYWGDLHNHGAVGYAKGSLERAYEIAKRNLDVFAFTGHAQWHDMPVMPQNKNQKWIDGFAVLRDNWPKVKKLAAEHYVPGEFVSFVGYEWHSSHFGDYCVIYPDADDAPLAYFDHVTKLQDHVRRKNAIMIPHHPGYMRDWRGANFDHLDTSVSPVVEFFSEHGLAEHDRGPYRYLRHSMGGRWTHNTMRALLSRGARVGVVASTDDHLGYPGAYQQGLVGIYANELTREGVFEAIRARRTYAVTADRIQLDFRLNGRWMGEVLPPTNRRDITVIADALDEIDRIEVVKNNRVVARQFPIDNVADRPPWNRPILCRLEFGWGPWGDLNMARIADWKFIIRIKNGKLLAVQPCFRSGPFDADRRNRVESNLPASCSVQSYTSRMQPLGDLVTNAVVLKLTGSEKTELSLELTQPAKMTMTKTLGDLAKSSDIQFTGPFTSESVMFHRLVFAPQFQTEFKFTDQAAGGESADYYYARVVQANGDLAFSSPIWVEPPSK